jgi:hypothetical protein
MVKVMLQTRNMVLIFVPMIIATIAAHAQTVADYNHLRANNAIVSVTTSASCNNLINGYKFVTGPFIVSSAKNSLSHTDGTFTAKLRGSIIQLHNSRGKFIGEVDLLVILRERFDYAVAAGAFQLEHEPIKFEWLAERRFAIIFTELFARRLEPAPYELQLATSNFCIVAD